MVFQYPLFLWLLPLVLLVWFVPRRGLGLGHGLLRTIVFAALSIGLARPAAVSASCVDHHVIVVDRSASVAAVAAIDTALAAVRRSLPDDAVRVLVEIGPSTAVESEGFDEIVRMAPSGVSSPLGAGLQCALRAIPEGVAGAVTLVSDGLATDDRWRRSAQELTERGLPLHVVDCGGGDGPPRCVGLDVRGELRVGHASRVRVVVAATDAMVRVSLMADGDPVARSQPVRCTGVRRIELSLEPPRPGFVELVATVERIDGPDPASDDHRIARTFAVQDPLRVVYLGDRVRGGDRHLSRLLGAGFELRVPGGEAVPDLSRTDLTILDDRPAAQLPTSWQTAIADAVQQRGMGLLLSGGRSAFGPGGYHDTVIETLSPVEFVQKEEKKDPSTTLAVVIDTSGSMVGNRMTLAKEVARLAIRRLQPHDKVGIVEFYGTKQWAAPIQSAANAIDLQRALNRLGASGGTVLFPAIEECYYALQNVQTRYKHVLVITDAGVETGPYEALLRKMADDGIATSTVLVGPGRHSEFLVELADWGGGRYYHSPDRFNLPELLLKKPSTSMLPPYRPGNFAIEARGGRGWWGEVDSRSIPSVQSLVETSPREGADVLMRVKETGRPVLASWRHGLGRVSALMTEPVGPGTRSWRRWPGYGPMLARLLSRTARSAQPPFSYALRREERALHVEVRREVAAAVEPSVRVDGGADVALREVATGVFRGELPAATKDTVRLVVRSNRGFLHRLCSDAFAARRPETQVDPRAALPMAAIAAHTGGVFAKAGDSLPALSVSSAAAPLRLRAVWPWFVLLSLVAFLMDVLHRRRAVDERAV